MMLLHVEYLANASLSKARTLSHEEMLAESLTRG
jgi:hypothetical protein